MAEKADEVKAAAGDVAKQKPEKADKTAKPEKAKTVKAEKPEKAGKPAKAAGKEKAKTVKAEKPEKAEKSGKPVKAAGKEKDAKAKAKAKAKAAAKDLDDLDKKGKKADSKPAAKLTLEEQSELDYPAPAEVGGVWPWRAGSTLRYCFQLAFEGISKANFKKQFEPGGELYDIVRDGATGKEAKVKAERSHDYMLKHLRAERAGKAETTHTWKLSEEGGRLKIHTVRYLLKKKKAEAA